MVALPPSKKTLLQMVQNACLAMSLPAPATVIGNNDPQIKELLTLANQEGMDFSREANHNEGWQQLRREQVFETIGFTTSGTVTENSPIITDIPDTTGFVVGYAVLASYLPIGARIASVDSATQITLDMSANGSLTNVGITVGKDYYSIPADLDYFMSATYWDRTLRWQLLGPLSPQEWQVFKSGIAPAGPRLRFRIMDNLFYIDPVPGQSGGIVAYEYYSINWAQSSTGTAQNQFLADTDYYLLDDECMQLGIQVRFKEDKGFDATSVRQRYDKQATRQKGRNGSNRNLPLNLTGWHTRFLDTNNIPDTGYGVPLS